MVERAAHPLVLVPPHVATWRRSERRRPAAGPEIHAELVALHGLRGEARYLLDGEVHRIRPGILLWALAGQRHVLLDEAPDFDQRVLLVSGALAPSGAWGLDLPPLSTDRHEPQPPRRLSSEATTELERIAQVAAAMRSPDLLAAGLTWWLVRAWAHWRAAAGVKGQGVHPAVTRAAWMLRDNPAADLSEIARHASLSQGRLSRLFREQTGGGLGAYRTARRLDRAEALFARGGETWLSAALDAGFGSYAAFFRAYVARYGHGPRGAADQLGGKEKGRP